MDFLKKEIPKLEKEIEEIKKDKEWYELTGENRRRTFIDHSSHLDFILRKLNSKKILLEKNMKKYKALKYPK